MLQNSFKYLLPEYIPWASHSCNAPAKQPHSGFTLAKDLTSQVPFVSCHSEMKRRHHSHNPQPVISDLGDYSGMTFLKWRKSKVPSVTWNLEKRERRSLNLLVSSFLPWRGWLFHQNTSVLLWPFKTYRCFQIPTKIQQSFCSQPNPIVLQGKLTTWLWHYWNKLLLSTLPPQMFWQEFIASNRSYLTDVRGL